MPAGIDHGGHHDLKQSVETGDRILCGICLSERRETADVDEHHCHLATLAGEHIVTLLE